MTTPSFMIGIEEVLQARIASGLVTTLSSCLNSATLAASSSTIASTTTSRSFRASSSVTTRIRSSTSWTESILPFAAARSSDLSNRPNAAFAAASLDSTTTTSWPDRALTSAMPEPIRPPPTTPTFFMNSPSLRLRSRY